VNEPIDTNETADLASPADSLDAGLAAGFGRLIDAPGSILSRLRTTLGPLRPVLLREAEGESGVVVKPKTDAMPTAEEAGDRYQLSGEIARGGMGAILRGRDVDLGRDLAVKVLLEKYADRPEIARRFIEEAQIGGQLQHPGVVPVYDIGQFGDRPYFTMKLVKGQTLAAILSDRTDPATERPRLLAIALQVSQTLAYAHAKGVIHRDLKPANIMVGAFGEVQVMDWGLAKVLASGGIADEELASRGHQPSVNETTIRTARSGGTSFGTDTEAGSLLGTPAYMPPEQANGDIAILDRRADVFGLGAILCEVLTGKPPYTGRSGEEVRRKAANGDLVEALARLDSSGADAEMISLTKLCLAAEPTDRPKDAAEVSESLMAYLDGVQDRLRRAELAEAEARVTAIEEARRRRLTLILAATILLAMTLGGGGWLWVKGEREARQLALTRDVNDALNKAMGLSERAKGAAIGGSALLAQAREQVQRALALIETGQADPSLVAQVKRLQDDLDQEEKDRTLVAALDAARLAQAELNADGYAFALERAVPLFREAFKAYGLSVGEGTAADAASRIRERPAPVREAILAALDEWDDLAGREKLKITKPHRQWLREVIEAADPEDGFSRQVRSARREPDQARKEEALKALAESVDVRKLPARALTRLSIQLDPAQEIALLRRTQRQYPGDFWVNQTLGGLLRFTEPDDAVRFLTAATALRPENPGSFVDLGNALKAKGRVDEAIESYRKAIEINPKLAIAHNNLGLALSDNGQIDEAIASYRKGIEIDPTNAMVHYSLGNALKDKGRLDEAIASYRKAIEIAPKSFNALNNLGAALRDKGQIDEASTYLRKAIELDPKNDAAHTNLGSALMAKRRFDEAITSCRRAIELNPKNDMAYNNLGTALMAKGQLDEAIQSYRKAIEFNPKLAIYFINIGNALNLKGRYDEAITSCRRAIELNPTNAMAHNHMGWALQSKGQLDEAIQSYRKAIEFNPKNAFAPANLARAESIAAGRDKFADFEAGRYKPATSREFLDLAAWCLFKKLNRTAAGLYADAFAADPKLADDVKAAHRYNAACYAALAAAGQGEDSAQIDEPERTRLRKQALDWLRADLTLRTRQLPADRAVFLRMMKHWQNDSDLTGIRDEAALAKLPLEEREAFVKLWADVADRLKQAQEVPKSQ
jgi:tetratricopeptide (TPR) repeat protein